MMAGFRQFLQFFSWNSLILGQCIVGVGGGGRVGGGKSLNKEEIRHKQ